MKTILNFFALITAIFFVNSSSAQLQYLTTIPPYNGGNSSAMAAFNVKAQNSKIEIKEVYCSFASAVAQNATIWYKTDSINGTPNVTAAGGWVMAGTASFTPSVSGAGTMVLIPITNLSIMIPAGAVYGMAVTSASVRYTGTGSTPTSPWVIGNSDLYISMGTGVGWGGTVAAPIQYRHFNGKLGYQLANVYTDAGLTKILSPLDSVCAGNQSFHVRMKNFGPAPLTSVKLNTVVNNVAQPVYNWSGTLAVNDSIEVFFGNYSFATGTTYNLKVFCSDPNNTPDTINTNDTISKTGVTVLPAFTGTISPSTSLNFCQNDSIMASVNSPTATMYKWFFNGVPIPGATASFYYVKQAGAYQVWFSDGLCSRISDTLYAFAHTSPLATLSTYTPTTFCFGDSVYLFANTGTGLSYIWKKDNVVIPGATASVYAARESGVYTVVTSNPGNCFTTSNAVAVVVHPAHPVNLGADTSICHNAAITLNAGLGANSYLWSTGATTPTLTVDSSGVGMVGTKNISVTTMLGTCESSDSILISFYYCTGMEELNQASSISLYPNPNLGVFSISAYKPFAAMQVSVYDAFGKLVYTQAFENSTTPFVKEFDLKLANGIYWINIVNDQESITKKMIVQ